MLQAYLDHLSVEPGHAVRIHANGSGTCRTTVRRLIHSDPHPGGPGVVNEDCKWGRLQFPAPEVSSCVGSFGIAQGVFAGARAHTVSLWHYPTDLGADSVIISWISMGRTWRLGLSGGLLTLSDGDTCTSLSFRHRERQWYFLGLSMGSGAATLFSAAWGRTGGPWCAGVGALSPSADADSILAVGALADADQPRCGNLDGRIAGLKIHSRQLDATDLMNEMNGFAQPGAAEWNFADTTDPDLVPSVVAGQGSLVLTNAPARTGQIPQPVDDSARALAAPGSIHFHRDDTEDCRWPQAAEVAIPDDAQSGFYCLLLESEEERFELPFIVSGRAAVTLLAPTLTWQAYGNLGRDPKVWPGRSHYALHTDGSPVFVTTSHRPTSTFAPGARLEVDADDGFLDGEVCTHLLMADLYAEYWLTQRGQHAVMDDRDLHNGGIRALDGVDVLVLSAHPEYWTAPMLDALDAFLARKGNVIYLGGNGLYWVSALHPTKPHLMEVRRWAGSQTVSAEPDERMHQFTSQRGGTWTDAGRPPNQTVGVSFAGFGGGPPMSYTRTEASYEQRWAWVFAGVAEQVIGGEGLNYGAGNEFDRFDERRRTAGDTVVLASSRPARPDSFGAYEEAGRRAPDDLVRADMTITRTRAGGLVFSLSSITASGCLPAVADSGIGRVCANVLEWMLAGTQHPAQPVVGQTT